jgi:two-component system, OmpR family, KDP operon response regulator KdpE
MLVNVRVNGSAAAAHRHAACSVGQVRRDSVAKTGASTGPAAPADSGPRHRPAGAPRREAHGETKSVKLLVVDDAPDVAEIVAFGARMTWPDCDVEIAGGGQEALRRFAERPPDVVVLDVAMPPPDGFEVCRRIRESSQVPILMLTVKDQTLDKVRALDLGADDYLTKPFDHLELLARLRALVRRSSLSAPAARPPFVAGDFSLDFATHEVRVGGQVVPLTATEYRLLEELVRHAGTVLPHALLLERVWGPGYTQDAHYLKVFVRRLRRKLGDSAEHPTYIDTAWGVGYRFLPVARAAGAASAAMS